MRGAIAEALAACRQDCEDEPDEVEEQRIDEAQKVAHHGSTERQGLTVFPDDADLYAARQLVLERLRDVERDLPPGVAPELAPISTGLGEIQYAASASAEVKGGIDCCSGVGRAMVQP